MCYEIAKKPDIGNTSVCCGLDFLYRASFSVYVYNSDQGLKSEAKITHGSGSQVFFMSVTLEAGIIIPYLSLPTLNPLKRVIKFARRRRSWKWRITHSSGE